MARTKNFKILTSQSSVPRKPSWPIPMMSCQPRKKPTPVAVSSSGKHACSPSLDTSRPSKRSKNASRPAPIPKPPKVKDFDVLEPFRDPVIAKLRGLFEDGPSYEDASRSEIKAAISACEVCFVCFSLLFSIVPALIYLFCSVNTTSMQSCTAPNYGVTVWSLLLDTSLRKNSPNISLSSTGSSVKSMMSSRLPRT